LRRLLFGIDVGQGRSSLGGLAWLTRFAVQDLEHFRFTIRGFSPKRMAYLLDLVSLGFIQVHFSGSCEQSGGIALFALINFVAIGILCFCTTRTDSKRFLPLALGLFILLGHMLCVH